jgi:hypothetical protein
MDTINIFKLPVTVFMTKYSLLSLEIHLKDVQAIPLTLQDYTT